MRHEKYYKNSDERAEVLYTLALLCTNSETCDRQKYVDLLHKEFPYSKYTKLIDNPTYVADYQIKNQEARVLYDEAFNMYKKGYYAQCGRKLNELSSLYPNNDIQDKIEFLSILILAKKDRMYSYRQGLETFIEQHKTSDIIPYAEKLLEQQGGKGDGTISQGFAIDTTSNAYYIVAIYSQDSLFSRPNAKAFNDEFLTTYYANIKFDIKQVELNEEYYIYTFKSLNDLTESQKFLDQIKKFAEFKEVEANYSFYIISKENYQVLINTEDVAGYRTQYKHRG